MKSSKSIIKKIFFGAKLFCLNFSRKKIKPGNAAAPSPLLVVPFFLLSLVFCFLFIRYDSRSVVFSRPDYSGGIFLSGLPYFHKKPAPVFSKGIYISSWMAGSAGMEKLFNLVKRTELNTVVIDIKDCTGRVAFDTKVPLVDEIGAEETRVKDLPGLLEKLHQADVYAIARLAVFEDPFLAIKKPDLALKDKRTGKIWKNYSGIAWVDPASKDVWDYNIQIAEAAIKIGFDEINFDYIRFPSDGNLSQIIYPFWDGQTPKYEVIRSFAEYADDQLKNKGAYFSADLFGLTFYQDDDLNIGQKLSVLLPYFDYLCPMVYPSHYASGFEGFKNPALYPYEVIYKTLTAAKPFFEQEGIKSKFRPWLQDFDMGANYDAAMVRKEIKAADDAGAFGWLLWNPSNIYTEGALLPEEK